MLRNTYCHLVHYITGLAVSSNGISSGLVSMSRHGWHFFFKLQSNGGSPPPPPPQKKIVWHPNSLSFSGFVRLFFWGGVLLGAWIDDFPPASPEHFAHQKWGVAWHIFCENFSRFNYHNRCISLHMGIPFITGDKHGLKLSGGGGLSRQSPHPHPLNRHRLQFNEKKM